MKVLSTNQRVLKCFFVIPNDEQISNFEKCFYALITLIILLAHFCAVTTGMKFFLKFILIDLEKAFYSLFNICGDIGVTYISLFLLVQRKKIVSIFKKISDIYEERKINLEKNHFPLEKVR